MQISSSSAATSSMALQALRDLFQTPSSKDTGQALPTGAAKGGGKGPPPSPPPGPPPAAISGGGFSTDTLASLLGTQETSATSSSDFASKVVDAADTNGDGTVSLEELAASLSAGQSTLADAFAKVDTDGDGQITAAELDTGLKAQHGRHGPHGPPPPQDASLGGVPSASDAALNLLASADADQSGSLSLSEIGQALGQDDTSALSDAFKSLDANGDGALASDELTQAITASLSRSLQAYAATANDAPTSSVSLAA